jgi:hypothetical protein
VCPSAHLFHARLAVEKMRAWAHKHLPSSPTPIRVLECGSGNGTLLLSFLTSPEDSDPQSFHLTGIDYSPQASVLARGVEASQYRFVRKAKSVECPLIKDQVPLLVDFISEKIAHSPLGAWNRVDDEILGLGVCTRAWCRGESARDPKGRRRGRGSRRQPGSKRRVERRLGRRCSWSSSTGSSERQRASNVPLSRTRSHCSLISSRRLPGENRAARRGRGILLDHEL